MNMKPCTCSERETVCPLICQWMDQSNKTLGYLVRSVRRRSSISGGLAPNQADAALLAERRASTVSTTKQAKPLGGEEQLQ